MQRRIKESLQNEELIESDKMLEVHPNGKTGYLDVKIVVDTFTITLRP